jgi:hypothetical protein
MGELSGMLPGLSPILAKNYCNRALEAIYGERSWSFLQTDGVIVCPAQINTGEVAIVQYSDDVTLDTTASAAVQDQITGAAEPGILQLQIRFSAQSPAAAQIYSIVAVDNSTPTAVVLTLDRGVQETTDATSTYTIWRSYVTPPITDFLRWESLVDYANAITLSFNRLTRTSADFDRMDPQRSSSGLSYYLGAWGGNRIGNPVTGATTPNATRDAGTPIYEFWPVPLSGQTWYARFRRKGELLINPTDTQLPGISDTLIIQKALYVWAYPFAQANVANFPSFKNANWLSLILAAKAEYKSELLDAKKNYQNQQLQSNDIWSRGYGLRSNVPFGRYGDIGYPIDSNFLQSHLVRF